MNALRLITILFFILFLNNKIFSQKSNSNLKQQNISDDRTKFFGVPLTHSIEEFDSAISSRGFSLLYEKVFEDGIICRDYYGMLTSNIPNHHLVIYASPISKRVYKIKIELKFVHFFVSTDLNRPYNGPTVSDLYDVWNKLNNIFNAKFGPTSSEYNDIYEGSDISEFKKYYDFNHLTGEQKRLEKFWFIKLNNQVSMVEYSLYLHFLIQGEDENYSPPQGPAVVAHFGINEEQGGIYKKFIKDLEDEKVMFLKTKF
jgi:hypothetical protein